jgi:fructose-1,6-bisphosphatase I
MRNAPVSGYASEEQEGFVDLKNNHDLIVFADPLDGSSNIDVNVSIGTIFSVMSQNNLPLEHAFLQKGSKQKAAGFFVYGPQITLFLTFGKGTIAFGLDENKSEFILINDKIKFQNQHLNLLLMLLIQGFGIKRHPIILKIVKKVKMDQKAKILV